MVAEALATVRNIRAVAVAVRGLLGEMPGTGRRLRSIVGALAATGLPALSRARQSTTAVVAEEEPGEATQTRHPVVWAAVVMEHASMYWERQVRPIQVAVVAAAAILTPRLMDAQVALA